MEGLAGELPVAPVCHSVSAGAWSRWYELHAPFSSHFSFFSRLFLRITCFEMQSMRKTQENNILLDVCLTKSMCWGYVLYMKWPVTVFKQRFHAIRNI